MSEEQVPAEAYAEPEPKYAVVVLAKPSEEPRADFTVHDAKTFTHACDLMRDVIAQDGPWAMVSLVRHEDLDKITQGSDQHGSGPRPV